MVKGWEEHFIDGQIEKAWLDLRLRIADHLADASDVRILNFRTPANDRLLVHANGPEIVVRANRTYYSPPSADAAALLVAQVLQKAWGVVHPCFLESDFLKQLQTTDGSAVLSAPVLGRAESADELRGWIVSTLAALVSVPIKVDADGDTRWLTANGHTVFVVVPNTGRIELRSVIAHGVGFKKAHGLMDQLTREWVGLRFYLDRDSLVMSQVLVGRPYVGEQLTETLTSFLGARDELSWVSEHVLSRRVKLERRELVRLKTLNAALEAELAELRAVTDSPHGNRRGDAD